VAVKVAAAKPAGTVADAGTVTRAVLLDNVTMAPPAAAGLLSVTVHNAAAPEPRRAGVHASEANPEAETSKIEALCELPA
jgi:hypothetical protein